MASAVTPDGSARWCLYLAGVLDVLSVTAIIFIFRKSNQHAPFRVPLYPVIPIAFCIACVYMLYSSINYVRFAVEFGVAVFAGLAIMLAGIPLYFFARNR
jgi:amino acid transporter